METPGDSWKLRAGGGWSGGEASWVPHAGCRHPKVSMGRTDLGVYLLLKTQPLAQNPLLFFGSFLKPVPQPRSSDHLCRKVSSVGPGGSGPVTPQCC